MARPKTIPDGKLTIFLRGLSAKTRNNFNSMAAKVGMKQSDFFTMMVDEYESFTKLMEGKGANHGV